MSATTDTGKEPVALGARKGNKTYHHVDDDGLALCGLVLSRQNERTSKEEHSKYWVKRRHRDGVVEKPQPEDRKPWYKWESEDEIADDYNECGMCQRVLYGNDGETYKQIATDIRNLVGLEPDGTTFTKDELREIREQLQ
jgi:hypothetical protein